MNRYYGLNQIIFGSFFGGPFAATYFIFKNYSAIGDSGAKFRTLKLGIAASVIVAVILLLLPRSTLITMIASLLWATVAYRIAKYRQLGRLVEFQNSHCTESGNFNVAVVAFCSTIAYMLLMLLVWLVFYAFGYEIT